MLDSGRFRTHHRSMLVLAAVSLLLLVGLVGFVLVSGSSSSLPASNAAAGCETPTGPTARGYGETGAGVASTDPACDPSADCDPAAADGPTGRGYGESGAVNVAPACGPCPTDPPGATARGYGESGVGNVLSDDCEQTDRSSDRHDEAAVAPVADDGGRPTRRTPAPLMGGGGRHGGPVPGATGRAAPRPVDAADHGAGDALTTPLSVAVVAPTPGVEGSRKNTALVVGGLVLLLAAVAVVLRRGRRGTAW